MSYYTQNAIGPGGSGIISMLWVKERSHLRFSVLVTIGVEERVADSDNPSSSTLKAKSLLLLAGVMGQVYGSKEQETEINSQITLIGFF